SVSSYPYEKISQPVSCQNHPSISNVLGNGNIANGNAGSRRYRRAVLVPTPRCIDQPTVAVSNLRCDLVTLFVPRLKLSGREFGELTPLKTLAVSQGRRLVS